MPEHVHDTFPRRRVLLIAFAYAPGAGSEAGVGYNLAAELSRHHDVTVVTDVARDGAPVDERPQPGHPRIVRLGLRWWPRNLDPMVSKPRLEAYYFFWLRMMASRLPALVQASGADIVQHVTYCRYWMPSASDTAGRPFVWGPVGGGESASRALLRSLPMRARIPAIVRETIRSVFERIPALSDTGSAASLAIGTTPETAARMARFTEAPVRAVPSVTLDQDELRLLGALPPPPDGAIRFMGIGRMLHWKGFDLGLEAFARLDDPDARYLLVGDGPERRRLERLALRLGIADRVEFLGIRPRTETLELLGRAHVLVHPSLHDSGGMVCMEAMAAARPVICLEGNGPAFLAGPTALTVPMTERSDVVHHLAAAMGRMSRDRALVVRLGVAARDHVLSTHTSAGRVATLCSWYEDLLAREDRGPLPDRPALPARHAFMAGMRIRS